MAGGLAEFHRHAEILGEVRDVGARVPGAADDVPGEAEFRRVTPGIAGIQRVDDGREIEPGIFQDAAALDGGEEGRVGDHVVDELHRVTGAGGAEMHELDGEFIEHRAGAIEHRRIAADEERELFPWSALVAPPVMPQSR